MRPVTSLPATPQAPPPSPSLKRIQALSRPVVVLVSIALGLLLVVRLPQIFATIFLFHGGDWQGWIISTETGLGLSVTSSPSAAAGVSVETLGTGQRISLAALMAATSICSALMLLNLLRLFEHYARGIVFERACARHLRQFAVWLVAAAVSANIAGKLFETITQAPPDGIANAAKSVVMGVMIYIIASVMQLAVEADQERKEFI